MAEENQIPGTPPTLFDYIRYSLDGMKRTSSAEEETNWGNISEVGKLANFTDAIITGHENKTTRFDSPAKLETFIINIAKKINIDSQRPLFRNSDLEKYIPAAEVQGKFRDFCRSLYARLKDNNDVQETAAYIVYEMDLKGKFFADNNHMIAQALEAFA